MSDERSAADSIAADWFLTIVIVLGVTGLIGTCLAILWWAFVLGSGAAV